MYSPQTCFSDLLPLSRPYLQVSVISIMPSNHEPTSLLHSLQLSPCEPIPNQDQAHQLETKPQLHESFRDTSYPIHITRHVQSQKMSKKVLSAIASRNLNISSLDLQSHKFSQNVALDGSLRTGLSSQGSALESSAQGSVSIPRVLCGVHSYVEEFLELSGSQWQWWTLLSPLC